ncbi:MAG: site-specific integrase [Gammaproteobacteria bacterium]|nr:site-specific integrase [Gammaproteobacteria bacterium]MDH3466864.1 site-specific integrase [Gammaproteobacteria bacterium]
MKKTIRSRTVSGLKPPPKRTEIRDTVLPGFGLRYWRSRSDPSRIEGSWFITYREHGKLRRHTIGSLSRYKLADARDQARELFQKLDKGQSLHDERLTANSFGAVAESWISRYAKRKHKNWQKTQRTIERELGDWKHRRIADITQADILQVLDRLTDQGKESAANRLYEYMRVLFAWAAERYKGLDSPMAGLKKPGKERKRDRVLTDDELRQLWPAFEAAGYPFGPLFQLLLVTGQRLTEVAASEWPEFDLDRRVWTIPSERYKSDRVHEVPLSDLAVDIIDELPWFTDTNLVFSSGRSSRPVSGHSKAKQRVDKLCDIAPWRLHDLRRTCRTNLGRLGVPPHVAELVIGHAQKGLHAVYDRYSYNKEKADALQLWAEHLKTVIGGDAAKVVSIR